MAGTLKGIVIGAVLGAGATTGVVVPLTGDQYAEGAAKAEMAAVAVAETTVYDAEAGKDVDVPAHLDLPRIKVNTMPDGERMVLRPGTKYRMAVEVDGKIIAEAEYTPDAEAYPTDGDSLVGVMKFDVVKDRM